MYTGEIKDGRAHGKGKYIWVNGEEYEGDFIDGYMHGYGIKKFRDGSFYKGEFKFGKISGKGVYSLHYDHCEQNELSSEEYDGEWENGERNGIGKMIKNLNNGIQTIYKGEWSENLFNGQGDYRRHTWAFDYDLAEGGYSTTHIIHTLRYEGCFSKGLKDGYGILYYENGDLYEGYWRNDKRHGLGTLFTRLRDVICKGEWLNDNFVGSLNSEKEGSKTI